MGPQPRSFSNLLKRKTCTHSVPTPFLLLRYDTLRPGEAVRRLARPGTSALEGERSNALGHSNASSFTGVAPSSPGLENQQHILIFRSRQKKDEVTVREQNLSGITTKGKWKPRLAVWTTWGTSTPGPLCPTRAELCRGRGGRLLGANDPEHFPHELCVRL